MPAESNWTAERVETLTNMWNDGCSASEIAMELRGTSRSAVLGKVKRLKLKGHTNAGAAMPKKPKSLYPNSNRGLSAKLAISTHRAAVKIVGPIPVDAADGVDVTRLVGIMQLGSDTCRWPKGDPLKPGFSFCG